MQKIFKKLRTNLKKVLKKFNCAGPVRVAGTGGWLVRAVGRSRQLAGQGGWPVRLAANSAYRKPALYRLSAIRQELADYHGKREKGNYG